MIELRVQLKRICMEGGGAGRGFDEAEIAALHSRKHV